MKLGNHDARLMNIEATQAEMKQTLEANTDKLDRILEVTERAKGSWKTLVAIGSSLAVIIEGVHQISDWMHK